MSDSYLDLVTAHVAHWGIGATAYAVVELHEPKAAVRALSEKLQGDKHWNDAYSVPVATYYIERSDVDEITLFGPQLMVRGQPVVLQDLTIERI